MPIRANASPPAEHDLEHVDQALDVVDDGRLAEQADVDRERRLVARLAAVALDRVEQRRLLAADVRAGAHAQLDVEVEPGAHHVVAEQIVRAGLGDRVREPLPGQRVLAAEVDVGVLGAGREAGDRQRLDQRERVVLDHDPVLERARLGLVGVADQVVRVHRVARHRVPLAAGRERGAAAAEQLRVGDLADHAGRAQLERAPQRRVAAGGAIAVEAGRVDVADPAQQPQARLRGIAAARLAEPSRRARRRRRPAVAEPIAWSLALFAGDRHERGGSLLAQAEARALEPGVLPSADGWPAGPTVCSSCSTSSALPRHMHAMSVQTCATRGGRGSSANSA